MPRGKSNHNAEILEYALRHLERERDEIQAKIDHVRSQLGGSFRKPPAAASAEEQGDGQGRVKRVLSAAARKRIALAQKRRWAEHRKTRGKEAG